MLRILTIVCAIGAIYSVPIDGVKGGSVPSYKVQETTKYAIKEPAGEVKVTSWQSEGADVAPTQVDGIVDTRYVPAIGLPRPMPKFEWVGQSAVKKNYGEEVIEQRKEEPVAIPQYEAAVTTHESYDPYRDILPEVIQGKRRLGDEDVNATQQVFGQGVVPQHVYTENTFPSIITLKGRQYLVVPHKDLSKYESYFTQSPQSSWSYQSGVVPTYEQKQIYHAQGNVVVPDIFKQWQANHQQYTVPVGTSYTEQSVHRIPQAIGHSYTTHHPPQSSFGQGTKFVSQSTYERPTQFVSTSQSAYGQQTPFVSTSQSAYGQQTPFVSTSQSAYGQQIPFVTKIQSAYAPVVDIPYSVPYWHVQPQTYYQTQGYYQPSYYYQTQHEVTPVQAPVQTTVQTAVQTPVEAPVQTQLQSATKTKLSFTPTVDSPRPWVVAPDQATKDTTRQGRWVVKGVKV
ncbi:uncharacterized protein LOC141852428 isoform X2 [Brevipalpus obovatus]|uniref:uncharacterized protein LOC141852428 isoform X2 n=1 Tax=Brevipalpus obovatus TaxID=246614 RepID=UPI003D9E5AD1